LISIVDSRHFGCRPIAFALRLDTFNKAEQDLAGLESISESAAGHSETKEEA
jgi:hypothetical protein